MYEIRRLGCDVQSIVVDPRWADPEARDSALSGDSPAMDVGLRPIVTANVGPRTCVCRRDDIE